MGLGATDGVLGIILEVPVDGWFCYWVVLFSSGSCCSGIWNGERRAEREQGGLEGLTGVDVLNPGSPGVVDGYRMVKGVESTSGARLVGRCRLVRGELLAGVLACAWEFSGFC
jgi:hypothetical protein